jgi:hypothetical protein
MENTKLDLAPIQEIEQELQKMYTPDFRGLAPGPAYRAACLFARINTEFEAAQGKVEVLGFLTFKDWMDEFQQGRQNVSRRNIFNYVRMGRYLIPQISEGQFKELGIGRAGILAAVAKAERLSPDFLRASFDYTLQELKQRAAPLLGTEVPWENRLEINGHEAAEAALIVLGNRLDYETFTADSGKSFQGRTLSEIATLRKLPRFPSEEIDRSAKLIDVIWVKDEWPEVFFEVEHTTNVKSGLQRMFQVLKLDAKFFIVAPKPVRTKFLRAINEAPFRKFKDKYRFRSYNELTKMFRVAIKYSDAHSDFFDKEE